MSWTPTTRGIGGQKTLCSMSDCWDLNNNTAFYTVDSHGTRYFCEKHWNSLIQLFLLIEECTFCKRAHAADLYSDARNVDMLKCSEKWWDICSRHLSIYFESLDIYTSDSIYLDLD